MSQGRERTGGTFVVGSERMARLHRQLLRVAPLDTTVLLQGESGTGKELAATLLHEHHPTRRNHRQVHFHCGAIPETLLESALFGHVKGAYTGADRDRAGVFERAHGGTLFLDEISTMSLPSQVRLLRVLQDRRVTRLGATDPQTVDVRVVVASNENLKELVDQGRFRLDLYYRLSTFPLVIPPLRERPGDILSLVDALGERIARRLRIGRPLAVSDDAMEALAAYAWPGNVRELENVVEYACIVAGDKNRIDREDLPGEIAGLPPSGAHRSGAVILTEEGLSFRTAVTNLERELILQSLRLAEGNKARAAGLLQLKRTTFLEKLRRLQDEGLLGGSQPERSSTVESGKLAV